MPGVMLAFLTLFKMEGQAPLGGRICRAAPSDEACAVLLATS